MFLCFLKCFVLNASQRKLYTCKYTISISLNRKIGIRPCSIAIQTINYMGRVRVDSLENHFANYVCFSCWTFLCAPFSCWLHSSGGRAPQSGSSSLLALSARRASVQPGGPISEVLFVYFAYLRRDRMGHGGDQIKCCDSVIFTVAVDSPTSSCLFKQQSD